MQTEVNAMATAIEPNLDVGTAGIRAMTMRRLDMNEIARVSGGVNWGFVAIALYVAEEIYEGIKRGRASCGCSS